MKLNHVGIANESEEKAVKFYQGLLGFKKTREFVVSSDLSEQLFSVSKEIKVLVFERDGVKIEVFICPECRRPDSDYSHTGLLIDNFPALKEKAREMGILVEGKAGEKTVYFLKDFSGNMIEIKPQ